MSGAGHAVRDALTAALHARAELAGVALFDRDPAANVLPRIEVAEAQEADWSAKDFRGREVRTAVAIRVSEGQRGRIAALTDAVEQAGEGLTGDIGGWRVAGALFLRVRGVPERGGYASLVEHRIRVIEV